MSLQPPTPRLILLALVTLAITLLSCQKERIIPTPTGQKKQTAHPKKRQITHPKIVAASRGKITDRNGLVLADNQLSYYLALHVPILEKGTLEESIWRWAQPRLQQAEEILGRNLPISQEDILAHSRQAPPRSLALSSPEISHEKFLSSQGHLLPGLTLHPFNIRHYPEGQTAAHLIGYVRKKPLAPRGPALDYSGSEGLEKTLEQWLAGQDGQITASFDLQGSRISEELTKAPVTGHTIVTTIDLPAQKRAETLLTNTGSPGAMVVIDATTSEVLVLASSPSYNLNLWLPAITQERWQTLRDHTSAPLFARAHQGSYPASSLLEMVAALSAFDQKKITEWLPSTAKKAAKKAAKPKVLDTDLDIKAALKLSSTNTPLRSKEPRDSLIWNDADPSDIAAAQALGFGKKSALPLSSESSGNLPDRTSYRIRNFPSFTSLQAARSMLSLVKEQPTPPLKIISRITSSSGELVEWAPATTKTQAPTTIRASSFRKTREAIVECSNIRNKWLSVSYA